MRIVYFLPDTDAGVARVVKSLLKYKPDTQNEYVVVLISSIENRSDHPVNDFEGPDYIVRFSYSGRENLYAVYNRLVKVLRSENDVVVGNDGWEIRMIVALKLKNPVAYILHGDFNYYYQVSALNQGVIDLYIALSAKISKELTERILQKENQAKVRMLYYPSAALEFEVPSVEKDPLLFKVLFAGTLSKRKGAHLLRSIYDGLSQQIANFELCIVGDGDLKQMISEQFSGCDRVVMEGWKPNEHVLQRMTESHVFLFPSFAEGLPNVLIEAIHCGAVPVASKLESGVVDLIEDGENGYLVNAGEVQGYVKAITKLYSNRELLHTMQQKGAVHIVEKFNPYLQAARYDTVIRELSSGGGTKIYPNYPLGRWLNKSWLPNGVVKLMRAIIKHPKL